MVDKKRREVGARKRRILLSRGWITVTYVRGLIRDVIGVVDGDVWEEAN